MGNCARNSSQYLVPCLEWKKVKIIKHIWKKHNYHFGPEVRLNTRHNEFKTFKDRRREAELVSKTVTYNMEAQSPDRKTLMLQLQSYGVIRGQKESEVSVRRLNWKISAGFMCSRWQKVTLHTRIYSSWMLDCAAVFLELHQCSDSNTDVMLLSRWGVCKTIHTLTHTQTHMSQAMVVHLHGRTDRERLNGIYKRITITL